MLRRLFRPLTLKYRYTLQPADARAVLDSETQRTSGFFNVWKEYTLSRDEFGEYSINRFTRSTLFERAYGRIRVRNSSRGGTVLELICIPSMQIQVNWVVVIILGMLNLIYALSELQIIRILGSVIGMLVFTRIMMMLCSASHESIIGIFERNIHVRIKRLTDASKVQDA